VRVKNLSSRDSVLVLWKAYGRPETFSHVLSPGGNTTLVAGAELLGTYKLVQVTKLVDDPTVTEVTDE
jgi:hypothetical protein